MSCLGRGLRLRSSSAFVSGVCNLEVAGLECNRVVHRDVERMETGTRCRIKDNLSGRAIRRNESKGKQRMASSGQQEGNIWSGGGIQCCSHSPPSPAASLCHPEPILHPPRRAPHWQGTMGRRFLSHAEKPPPIQSGRLFGSSMLATSSASQRGGTACKVQAVHADPPVPCKPEALWPMGGRTWPLGCGRVAELGLLHINHLAKALTSVEQSPTMVQSAAAPRGARPAGFWAPLHLAQHCSRLLGACLSRTLLAAGPAFPPHFVGLRRGTYLFEMRKRSGRSC